MRERIWTVATAAAWLVFCAAAYATPRFVAYQGSPVLGLSVSLQVVSVALAVAILLTLLFAGTKAVWSAQVRLGMFICGALGIAILYWLNDHGPAATALLGLDLCAVALPIGYWLGSQMQRISHLVPLSVAMAMADVYSVAQGPSKSLAAGLGSYQAEMAAKAAEAVKAVPPEQASAAAAQAAAGVKAPLISYLLVHVPLVGQQSTAPAIGIGDLIALAFIFRAVWVHRLNPLLAFVAAFVCTLGALAIAQLSHMAVPALPVIAGGMLLTLMLSDHRLRRLDRQEVVLSVGVVLLFGALLAAKLLM